MSSGINVAEMSGGEAEVLVNEECRVSRDQEWLSKFRNGFGDEFADNRERFSARSNDKRTYYVISNRDRKEALIGVRFRNSSVADIVGIGRLFKKSNEDIATLEGWRYLQVLLDEELIPKGIRRVEAQLVTKGGLEAFEQFEKECYGGHGKYRVAIRKNNIETIKGTFKADLAIISIDNSAA